MTELRFAPAAGAELAYADEGAGDPVLLVHAGIGDLRMWDPLVALLGGRRRTLRPDLRGFGATRYDAGAFSPDADLLAVLDAAGVERATLVGASFGGWVALGTAARHPDRCERLLLLAPLLLPWEWSAGMEAFFEREEAAFERGDIDAAAQHNVEMWAPHAAPPVRELVHAMQSHALRLQLDREPEPQEADPPDLAGMTVPTDVLSGDRDVADFQAIARHIVVTLPGARLRTVPGAGHLIALEQPGAVAALL